jgi:hypothetical protein
VPLLVLLLLLVRAVEEAEVLSAVLLAEEDAAELALFSRFVSLFPCSGLAVSEELVDVGDPVDARLPAVFTRKAARIRSTAASSSSSKGLGGRMWNWEKKMKRDVSISLKQRSIAIPVQIEGDSDCLWF